MLFLSLLTLLSSIFATPTANVEDSLQIVKTSDGGAVVIFVSTAVNAVLWVAPKFLLVPLKAAAIPLFAKLAVLSAGAATAIGIGELYNSTFLRNATKKEVQKLKQPIVASTKINLSKPLTIRKLRKGLKSSTKLS